MRRKTILIFDEDEDNRLVGFAAWRIKTEELAGMTPVGEVRWMGIVPDRQREGIGAQLLANALQIMFHENGSELLIRIDVDTENANARHAYERWGFEHFQHFESGDKQYEMLLLRPSTDSEQP